MYKSSPWVTIKKSLFLCNLTFSTSSYAWSCKDSSKKAKNLFDVLESRKKRITEWSHVVVNFYSIRHSMISWMVVESTLKYWKVVLEVLEFEAKNMMHEILCMKAQKWLHNLKASFCDLMYGNFIKICSEMGIVRKWLFLNYLLNFNFL